MRDQSLGGNKTEVIHVERPFQEKFKTPLDIRLMNPSYYSFSFNDIRKLKLGSRLKEIGKRWITVLEGKGVNADSLKESLKRCETGHPGFRTYGETDIGVDEMLIGQVIREYVIDKGGIK